MQPALYPVFATTVTDYVVRCVPGIPVSVSVSSPADTMVSIDSQPSATGSFTIPVNLSPGQEFPIGVTPPGSATYLYYVRCLPADFPQWTAERPGTPQAGWYVVAPITGGKGAQYVAIFDSDGVPVWWLASSVTDVDGFDAELLSNVPGGEIELTAMESGGGEDNSVYSLNGSVVAQPRAVAGSTEVTGDVHEIQSLPNGDYLLIGEYGRIGDLSVIGGATSEVFVDDVIQEVDPDDNLVWQWDSADNIPLTEVPPRWWSTVLFSSSLADPYHMNSLAWDNGNVLVSFRHLDAIYEIDASTGSIVWKLGGIPRAESLTPLGDPDATPMTANGQQYTSIFGGQHDARVLADGTVTVSDNQTLLPTFPRGVHYRLDPTARTATWLEQVSDPTMAPTSRCCGSASKLPGGNWLVDWGFNPCVEELTASGDPVFRLTFSPDTVFSYRSFPVLPDQLSTARLRAGMNQQYPR